MYLRCQGFLCQWTSEICDQIVNLRATPVDDAAVDRQLANLSRVLFPLPGATDVRKGKGKPALQPVEVRFSTSGSPRFTWSCGRAKNGPVGPGFAPSFERTTPAVKRCKNYRRRPCLFEFGRARRYDKSVDAVAAINEWIGANDDDYDGPRIATSNFCDRVGKSAPDDAKVLINGKQQPYRDKYGDPNSFVEWQVPYRANGGGPLPGRIRAVLKRMRKSADERGGECLADLAELCRHAATQRLMSPLLKIALDTTGAVAARPCVRALRHPRRSSPRRL